MPQLPEFLARPFERAFAKPATVVEIRMLGPRLRRVRFTCAALVGATLTQRDRLEFRVERGSFRHYTPAAFDPNTGTLDVVFFLHGRGPGSAWAAGLTEGDEVGLMGPGPAWVKLPPDAPLLLLGDESCVGLALWLQARARSVDGVLEVDADCREAAAATGLEVVERRERGDALVAWMRAKPLGPEQTVLLSGHAQTIGRLRKLLLGLGVRSRRIRVEPYWADNKRGL